MEVDGANGLAKGGGGEGAGKRRNMLSCSLCKSKLAKNRSLTLSQVSGVVVSYIQIVLFKGHFIGNQILQ